MSPGRAGLIVASGVRNRPAAGSAARQPQTISTAAAQAAIRRRGEMALSRAAVHAGRLPQPDGQRLLFGFGKSLSWGSRSCETPFRSFFQHAARPRCKCVCALRRG